MRCDVNISVRPEGQQEYGVRTELKNLNSFSAAMRAIEFETKRHIAAIEDGEELVQETRRWDDAKGKSFSMRDKEEAHDYRYFPDPDLVPIYITDEQIQAWKDSLPELPAAKKERFIAELGLPEYDAKVLTTSKYLAQYFEDCFAAYGKNAKTVSNYVMGEVMRLLKEENLEPKDIPVEPKALAELLNLVDNGTINSSVGKQVFEEMFKTGKSAASIVEEKGLKQISDDSAIRDMIKDIIAANPKSVEDYKGGKAKALTFFVGQVMKATKGKANPKIVNEITKEELDKA